MNRIEQDFFAAMPEVLPIYKELKEKVLTVIPNLRVEVRKTQISFKGERVAMTAWLPLLKVKARPEHYLIVTLWLSSPLRSGRIAEAIQVAPDRWVNHILLADIKEVDDELMGWIAKAFRLTA